MIFDYYTSSEKRDELAELLSRASQLHAKGVAANFLEKDLWVTEVLRLLFDENLLGPFSIAFKGGTALSKCWQAIERFSEDIDLSIHWADLAGHFEATEHEQWLAYTKNSSQKKKFKEKQQKRLTDWTEALVATLNKRFSAYNIENLSAELLPNTGGEQIQIRYPTVIDASSTYQLDYILLEFGGRNRGKPTQPHKVSTYLSEIPSFETLALPSANVAVYDSGYIVWEKLTALHQFCTQEKNEIANRLARHWYDVDCMLTKKMINPLEHLDAMRDVIEMKKQRWPVNGVDYELILRGKLCLIPPDARATAIAKDHQKAVDGGLFFSEPDSFAEILGRLNAAQEAMNAELLHLAGRA
jgi:hypothetical protein